ncbi:MAG: VWA domain-containing protein [Acidobacteria bacterium]|nr:VWA domain-containing protein [Acidobacteriota bacterium]
MKIRIFIFLLITASCLSITSFAKNNLTKAPSKEYKKSSNVTKPIQINKKNINFNSCPNISPIKLSIGVTDEEGRNIINLKRENFAIFEEGKQQQISDFQTANNFPLYTAIIFDNSLKAKGQLKFQKESVSSLLLSILKSSNSSNQVLVTTTNTEVFQDFSQDLELCYKTLNNIKTKNTTDISLYDSIYMTCQKNMANLLTPNKVIVVISSGSDTSSKHTLQETIDIAQKSQTKVFFVNSTNTNFFADSLNTSTDEGLRSNDTNLQQLCEQSGGKVFLPKNVIEFERALNYINGICAKAYLISYQPSNNESGYRRVDVKLLNTKSPNYKASTIAGYNSPFNTSAKKPSVGNGKLKKSSKTPLSTRK